MNKIFCIISFVILFLFLTACTFNNDSTENDFLLSVKGKWIADGTQYYSIIGIDDDNNPIYAEKDLPPYYLVFDGKGNYTLELNNYLDTGTYEVNDERKVIFNSKLKIWSCQLENDNELYCESYASLFIKE